MAIVSGEIPDIMEVGDYDTLKQLYENDLIADLTEVYENCASDKIKEIYDSYDGVCLKTAMFDGKLMGLPTTEISHGPGILWLRKDWMDKCGLEEPKTMEDIYNILEQFLVQDPGGNGEGKTVGLVIDPEIAGDSGGSYMANNNKTPEGEMGNRVGDWGDIVDLDYGNKELWDYQIDTLKMWAGIVDGFRCDVAPLVSLAFWLKAREEVARVNPECIWLSESVEPEFIVDMRAKGMTNLSDSEIFQAFDMCYDYDIFKYFRQYLNGEGTLGRYVEAVNMQEYIYPANYVKMRYLENHDQDRAKEIIPKESALRNWTAFLYFQKGATLLYAGQENQNETRPDLFNKDVINLDGSRDISDMLRQLYQIKKLPVVAKSSYRLSADEGLGAAIGEHKEIQGKGRLLGIFSFEGKCGQVEAGIQDGTYTNMVNGKEIRIEDGKIDLKMCPVIIKENGE